jgi:uncharacterized membrane protein
MDYLIVKWLHVLSSTLLFGTGLGSAYYMFFTNRSRDVRAIAVVTRRVVVADWTITLPTGILQPLTGAYLVHRAGFDWSAGWIAWSVLLYLVAMACWLPVVWLQIRMARMAEATAAAAATLPDRFWRYHRIWTALGIPAFSGFVVVFYLMVVKPA